MQSVAIYNSAVVRPITTNEIDSVISKLLTKKNCGLDNFTGELNQTLKNNTYPSHTISREKKAPSSFYKATIILDSKTRKRHYKKKKIMGQYP